MKLYPSRRAESNAGVILPDLTRHMRILILIPIRITQINKKQEQSKHSKPTMKLYPSKRAESIAGVILPDMSPQMWILILIPMRSTKKSRTKQTLQTHNETLPKQKGRIHHGGHSVRFVASLVDIFVFSTWSSIDFS